MSKEFNTALQKSLKRAIENVRHADRPGHKIRFTPFKDKSNVNIAHRFPENPGPGSAVAKALRAFELAGDLAKSVPAAKREIYGNPNLSDQGKKLALTEWVAKNNASKWRKEWNALAKERENLVARLEKIKLKPADPSPEKAAERAEIRARLASMNDTQRNEFLQKYRRGENEVIAAIVERIPELSGVNEVVYESILAETLDIQHAGELADIAESLEAISAAERAIDGGREESRKQSGIGYADYEKIVGAIEAEADAEFAKSKEQPVLPSEQEKAELQKTISNMPSKDRSELIDFIIGKQFESIKTKAA